MAFSDLHLSSETAERNELFLRALDRAKSKQWRVVVVGDLFDLWLGWKNLTFTYQRSILEAMADLARNGLVMTYVEGNRDYGIDSYEGPIFSSVASRGFELRCGDRRVYFEHGDCINRKDRQYRVWRKFSKNGASFWFLGHLPASFLLKMAQRLEKGMKRTNLKYRIQYPDSEVNHFCREKMSDGFDIIVFGHFHEGKEFVVQDHDKNVLCYNLPGWEKGLRYLVIPEVGKPVFEEM